MSSAPSDTPKKEPEIEIVYDDDEPVALKIFLNNETLTKVLKTGRKKEKKVRFRFLRNPKTKRLSLIRCFFFTIFLVLVVILPAFVGIVYVWTTTLEPAKIDSVNLAFTYTSSSGQSSQFTFIRDYDNETTKVSYYSFIIPIRTQAILYQFMQSVDSLGIPVPPFTGRISLTTVKTVIIPSMETLQEGVFESWSEQIRDNGIIMNYKPYETGTIELENGYTAQYEKYIGNLTIKESYNIVVPRVTILSILAWFQCSSSYTGVVFVGTAVTEIHFNGEGVIPGVEPRVDYTTWDIVSNSALRNVKC